jgi:putative spermidine/putrescine transport system ATP-binding protein
VTVPAVQIEARAVVKSFGSFQALDGIDLDVRRGEFLTLLGPSGSGKTTFLNVLAGFEMPTSGRLLRGGQDITRMPAEARNFGMVFQGYALFPHMTVRDNVAFPLRVRKVPAAARREEASRLLDLVGLAGQADKHPRQLSGGQQQRAALARALVFKPDLLLLDEPLSALDKSLREQMQTELRRVHREVGTTFVFVTHDQDEALSMSDRVAIFRNGRLCQVDAPEVTYLRPRSRFVAEFLGQISLFQNGTLGAVTGVRPEAIHVRAAGAGEAGVDATVHDIAYHGARVSVELMSARSVGPIRLSLTSGSPEAALCAPGRNVPLAWSRSAEHVLTDDEETNNSTGEGHHENHPN